MTFDLSAFDGGFLPWIGADYAAGLGGVRTLVLGESHYLVPESGNWKTHRDPAFTRTRIEREVAEGGRLTYFERLTALVSPDGRPDAALWHRLAFFNVVERFVGDAPRQRPDGLHWADAEASLLARVGALRPGLVLVTGFDLWKYVRTALAGRAEETGKRQRRLARLGDLAPDGGEAPCAFVGIMHPSAYGFKLAEWRPVVQPYLNAAPSPDAGSQPS